MPNSGKKVWRERSDNKPRNEFQRQVNDGNAHPTLRHE